MRHSSDRPIELSRPEPGWWTIRLTKGGPPVAAAIFWVLTEVEPGCPENDMRGTRSRFLAAFILGDPVPLDRVWTASKIERIDETEYRHQVALYRWAKRNAPTEAIGRPRDPIDLFSHPPPTW